MFTINHDKNFVYSKILVKHNNPKINDDLTQKLMWIWANETAIPYIEWMKMFKTDTTKWYIIEEND